MLGDLQAFRALAEDSWAPAGHVDLQPFWCEYLALLAAIERRPRAAARLAGHAAAGHGGALMSGVNEAQAHARVERIAREALGDAEYERLAAEGALMRAADIPALAFAMADAS